MRLFLSIIPYTTFVLKIMIKSVKVRKLRKCERVIVNLTNFVTLIVDHIFNRFIIFSRTKTWIPWLILLWTDGVHLSKIELLVTCFGFAEVYSFSLLPFELMMIIDLLLLLIIDFSGVFLSMGFYRKYFFVTQLK